ncbi:MAG: right-handed parallel beta-helix repeat-containing protein [Candidatus Thiothrix sulfatifontis]|nr:MAG: right-handed parallel beta-helix repeat-containing protein [Candidatus Thiothrix sulfatifontis]
MNTSMPECRHANGSLGFSLQILFALLLLTVLTGQAFAANCTATYTQTNTGGSNNYTLTSGQSLKIASGTYTGTVEFGSGASICVETGATFAGSLNNPAGTLTNYGTTTLAGAAFNAGTVIDNSGTFTFTGNPNTNGATTFHNRANATMSAPTFQLGSNSTFTNDGIVNATGDLNTTLGTILTNNYRIEVDGNFNPDGTFTNNGRAYAKNFINMNSSATIINNCTLVSYNGFNSNNPNVTNNGTILITKPNNKWQHNGSGVFRNGSNAKVAGYDFINSATVTGSGAMIFSGSTTNQGAFTGNSASDKINFYDETQTGSQFFDFQNTAPTNTVRTIFTRPTELDAPTTCTASYKAFANPSTTGTISGTVYTDSNTNNAFDSATESGIGSITVSLLNNATGVTIAITSTAADGSYSFGDLDPALTYKISADTTDADLPVGATIGTSNPLASVTVAANSTTANQNFGFDAPATGVCPAGMYVATQSGNAVNATSTGAVNNTTAAIGALASSGASATTSNSAKLNGAGGTLILDLGTTIPGGSSVSLSMARTKSSSRAAVSTSLNNSSYSAVSTLSSASTSNGVLAYKAYTIPAGGARYIRLVYSGSAMWVNGVSYTQVCQTYGAISGTVYTDSNTNNALDAAETKLPNIAVRVYNSAKTTLLKTATTNASGVYTAPGLTVGTYQVEVETTDADLPSGSSIGTTNPLASVTVAANSVTADQNFGFDQSAPVLACSPPPPTTTGINASITWNHNPYTPSSQVLGGHPVPAILNTGLIASAANEMSSNLTTGPTDWELYTEAATVPSTLAQAISGNKYFQYSFTTQASLTSEHILYGVAMSTLAPTNTWQHSGKYKMQIQLDDNPAFTSPAIVKNMIQIDEDNPTVGGNVSEGPLYENFYISHYDLDTPVNLSSNKTYYLRFYLYDVAKAGVANGVANRIIFDDLLLKTMDCDASPTTLLSVSDAVVKEGNSGLSYLNFPVQLSAAAPAGGVSFNYTTTDGTATLANNDYQAKTGTLTIPIGANGSVISVPVVGDTTVEPNEKISLNITNVINAQYMNGSYPQPPQGSIIDDDAVGACNASSGHFGGIVFQDYNQNGTRESGEVGLAGITVTAYNSSNTAATTTTDADGWYKFTGLTNGASYRLEFTNLSAGIEVGTSGTNANSNARFVTVNATCDANLGVYNPVDYCQADPKLLTARYINGDNLASGTNMAGSFAALLSFNYNDSGIAPPTLKQDALGSQVGSIWGLAYNRHNKKAFAAAMLRRHVGLGPLGIGGLYVVNYSGTNPVVSNFLNLDALPGIDVGSIGSNSDRNLPGDPYSPSHDPTMFDKVGKEGLGDIELSDDGNTLYVSNLYSRKIIKVDLTAYNANGTVPTTASEISLPAVSCTKGVARPFALKYYRGKLHAGITCTGENGGSSADLKASIHAYDGTNWTEKLNVPLNYPRWHADHMRASEYSRYNIPWVSSLSALTLGDHGSADWADDAQLMLSGIEFDTNGDMLLGFIDRTGLQFGQYNYGTDTSSTRFYGVFSNGELLKASYNATTGAYTLENAGTANGIAGEGVKTGTDPAWPYAGPGGGEFYGGEKFVGHTENAFGALALIPGKQEVALNAMNPFNITTGGTIWLNNQTGTRTSGAQLYGEDNRFLGKAVGLGDLEVLCDPAPTEIGNRVWLDADKDGLQDAGEAGIANINVTLTCGTDNATAATNAQGEYYFSNKAGGNATFMGSGESCSLSVSNTQASLSTYSLTTQNADGKTDNNSQTDIRDSDAAVSGSNATISFTLGNAGQNNHGLDFGYQANTSTEPPASWTSQRIINDCHGTSSYNPNGADGAENAPCQSYSQDIYENWDSLVAGAGDTDIEQCRLGYYDGTEQYYFFAWQFRENWNYDNTGESREYHLELDTDHDSASPETPARSDLLIRVQPRSTYQGNTWHAVGNDDAIIYKDTNNDVGCANPGKKDTTGCSTGYEADYPINQGDAFVRILNGQVELAIKAGVVDGLNNVKARCYASQTSTLSKDKLDWHDQNDASDLSSHTFDSTGFAEVGPNVSNKSISGKVFEDKNYGGGAGRPFGTAGTAGVRGATVELRDASNAVLGSTTTATDGSYTFTNIPGGNYSVQVVATSVNSTRIGSNGTELGVMTYRTNGIAAGETTNGVGGQAVQPVTVAASNLSGVDFGFNFDTIVNANDSGQGSLRQFILNANLFDDASSLVQQGRTAGKENAIFELSTSDPNYNATHQYWSIAVQSELPFVYDNIIIDASTQPTRTTAPGFTFANRPVIELNGINAGQGVRGLTLNGGNEGSTVRYLAINRFKGAGLKVYTSKNNLIEANNIGTDPMGSATNMGNGEYGIYVISPAGLSTIRNNIIAHNAKHGITVWNYNNEGTTTAATISGNNIYANGGLGIDLGISDANSGVTINDANDTDTGANSLLNFPVLANVSASGGNLTLKGCAPAGATIELFEADVSAGGKATPGDNKLGKTKDYGEGQIYLTKAVEGSAADTDTANCALATDVDGNTQTGMKAFSITVPAPVGLVEGDRLTATATVTNVGTSEFSPVYAYSAGCSLMVTVTADTDTPANNSGSLRDAIECANTTPEADTITFNIPNTQPGYTNPDGIASNGDEYWSIQPTTPLPGITTPLVIDGSTQPGTTCPQPRVEIDGSSAGAEADGIGLYASNSTIKGLIINDFSRYGIRLSRFPITFPVGNTLQTNNSVQCSYIGVNASGLVAKPNLQGGIAAEGDSMKIGGTTAAERNIISGNGAFGIYFYGGGSTNGTVQGNYIGVGANGTTAIGNQGFGIGYYNTDGGGLIGGTAGITVNGACTGTCNLIAHNTSAGIGFFYTGPAGRNVRISGNAIHSNGGIGIDLERSSDPWVLDGVNPNDAGDSDSAYAPNGLQNYPILNYANLSGATTDISGTLNSIANATFTLEFFANTTADATGYGEGERYLGNTTVTTDGSGNATFTASLPAVDSGTYITATATDAGNNTSEFSTAIAAAVLKDIAGKIYEDVNYGGGNGRAFNAATAGMTGINGASIELRDSSNNVFATTTSTADGSYTFTNIPVGAYSVQVVNASVRSTRSGSNGSERGVITYRTDGVNNVSTASTAFSQAITLSNANLSNVNFGFNFDTVTNTNDSGAGSLRQFLLNANLLGGDATLAQVGRTAGKENAILEMSTSDPNYATGYWSIPLQSALPNITGPIVLDGSAPSGSNGNPILELKGTNAGSANGLTLSNGASRSIIRELAINGFAGAGIQLDSSRNNILQGNHIGATPTGTARANGGAGILLTGDSPSDNQIGGVSNGAGNLIANNGGDGIAVGGFMAARNSILGNSIYANTGLGIDLIGGVENSAGVTANDIGDADNGPNNLLNYPDVKVNSFGANGTKIVTYDFNLDVAAGDYRLEFFTSAAKDASGNGEGQTLIGSKDLSHPGTGSLNFKGTLNSTVTVAQGAYISVTLTQKIDASTYGSTSEFSGIKDGISIQVCDSLIDDTTSGADMVIDETNITTVIKLLEAKDANGNPITYVVSGGSDGNFFTITNPAPGATLDCATVKFVINSVIIVKSAGDTEIDTRAELPPSLTLPPGNYESPMDSDKDNVYDLEITATTVDGAKYVRDVSVRVMNTNEAPTITSTTSLSVTEDTSKTVLTVAAQDSDANDKLNYRISGGADGAHFEIEPSTGLLRFRVMPDYDAPMDANRDNVYEVEIAVTDTGGLSSSKLFKVSVVNNTADDGVTVSVRAMLQGAYDSKTALMVDTLNTLGLLPNTQPYQADPFKYAGTETLSTVVQEMAGNDAVVDWILVELRTGLDTVAASRALILQRDGDVVDSQTGSNLLHFAKVKAGNYYVSVRHRNHLGMVSASPISLSSTAKALNFASNAMVVSGDETRIITGTVALMWAGDINVSNTLSANGPNNDVTSLLGRVITAGDNTQSNTNHILTGYISTDINFDGKTLFTGPGNDTTLLVGNILLHPLNNGFAANYIVKGGLQ